MVQIHLLGKFHNFFYPLGTFLLLLSLQVYEAIALLFYPPFPPSSDKCQLFLDPFLRGRHISGMSLDGRVGHPLPAAVLVRVGL